jgi:hypothetical protein
MITVRHAIGWAAVLGTFPYLVLKAVWLAGGTVGITDPAMFDDGSVWVLNAVTAGMDVVAIVVALAFTYSWGLRVPGFFVLVPIWIGTGLLAPITVLLPTMDFGDPQPFLEPWVQPLVYGGFAWQGVMLTIAFVFYAMERWPFVFRMDTADAPAAGAVRAVAAHVGALLAAAGGVRFLAEGTFQDIVFGVFSLGAAAGTVVMTNRIRGRFWVPVVITWVGAGATFAWGAWAAVNSLGDTFLDGGAPAWPALLGAAGGLVIGLTSLALLSGCGDRRPCTAAFAGHPRTRGGR